MRAVLIVVLLSATSFARGGEPDAERDADGFWLRRGWFGGMTLGYGGISETAWDAVDCGACATGFMLAPYVGADVGYRLTRRWAVVAAVGAALHSNDLDAGGLFDFQRLDAGTAGVGAQLAAAPDLSLRALAGASIIWADAQLGDVMIDRVGVAGAGLLASAEYEITDVSACSVGVQLEGQALFLDGTVVSVAALTITGRLHAERR